ncbi:MAG: DegT/DnrJ/EryC1/StrS family aminotransferase [Hyphomicrobiaceae bacterium]|nr:DegT/DnrJ/EryC1/StrS family aminotransferase [Hyphomicrobiaceae bacterium]
MGSEKFYPVSRPSLSSLEEEYVVDAVRSGWVSSLGAYVDRFEEEFSKFCNVEHGVAVSNGTAALHVSLRAIGVGPGDEVIVPDLSFIATANAVCMAGATPVFCDVEAETLCMDPNGVDQLITSRTKAIIPVHLYGHPAPMSQIMDIARKNNLLVIEDAAEAHGARIGDDPVGSFGDCAVFSFYGNKNLTTGEGGIIVSNDKNLIEKCRLLRDHSMSANRRYWHEELGYNYRMTNVQAAIGCAQMARADLLTSKRKDIFLRYNTQLAPLPELTLNRQSSWATSAVWLTCVEVAGLEETKRDELIQHLRQHGIDTRPYFYPMSRMPYLPDADTPVAHEISQSGLNLPTYVDLTDAETELISAQFIESCRALKLVG